MTDGDSIAQVAVVILLLGLSVPALTTAHDYAGTPFEYEETLTVDQNNTTTVSENATVEGYSENITLIAPNDAELDEGDDYRWNASNGTVMWLNTQATNDGDQVDATYDAYQRTQESRAAWAILAPLMGLFGLFGFVAGVRALWQFTAEVWGL